MNGTRIKIANGEYIDSIEIRRAMLDYVYGKVVFEGTIARGMPSPEEQFSKATGIKFDPSVFEIYYMGADGYDYDEPMTPFEVHLKHQVVPPVHPLPPIPPTPPTTPISPTSLSDYNTETNKEKIEIEISEGISISELINILREALKNGISVFYHNIKLKTETIKQILEKLSNQEYIGSVLQENGKRQSGRKEKIESIFHDSGAQNLVDDKHIQSTTQPVSEDDQRRIVRVVKKSTNPLFAPLVPMILAVVIASSVTPKFTPIMEENQDLSYGATLEHVLTDDEIQGLIAGEIADIEMGDYIYAESGDTFNQGSNLALEEKTIGGEFSLEGKEAGDYRVSGFSVVVQNKNGKSEIVDYIEDFDGNLTDINLGDFVNDTCKNHNLNPSEVKVRIHLGINGDYTRLGWIDVTDLITVDDLNIEDTVTDEYFDGYVEDFQGDKVTLSNGTTLKVTDSNGNILPANSKVIGSDGKEYEINYLNIITNERDTGKKRLEFEVNLPLLLGGGLATAIGAVLARRKFEEGNPTYFEFDTQDKKDEFVNEFVEAGVKKDNDQNKDLETLQELSSEQGDDLHEKIIKVLAKEYEKEASEVILKNGEIFMVDYDGNVENVTNLVMPHISSIGKNNPNGLKGIVSDDMRKRY